MMGYQSNGDAANRLIRSALVKGVGSAVRFLEREAKALVSRGQPRLVEDGVATGTDPSKPGEPPKVVTGTLRSSIGSELIDEGNGRIVGRVGIRQGPAHIYAAALEFGSQGGQIIRPIRAKALRFLPGGKGAAILSFLGKRPPKEFKAGVIGGEVVYRKSVVRGTIAPRPFLRPTLAHSREKIGRIIRGEAEAASVSRTQKEIRASATLDPFAAGARLLGNF